jgi:hypothetical protein
VIFFLDQSERVSKLTQEMAVYGGLMISANRKALNETAWHNGAARSIHPIGTRHGTTRAERTANTQGRSGSSHPVLKPQGLRRHHGAQTQAR